MINFEMDQLQKYIESLIRKELDTTQKFETFFTGKIVSIDNQNYDVQLTLSTPATVTAFSLDNKTYYKDESVYVVKILNNTTSSYAILDRVKDVQEKFANLTLAERFQIKDTAEIQAEDLRDNGRLVGDELSGNESNFLNVVRTNGTFKVSAIFTKSQEVDKIKGGLKITLRKYSKYDPNTNVVDPSSAYEDLKYYFLITDDLIGQPEAMSGLPQEKVFLIDDEDICESFNAILFEKTGNTSTFTCTNINLISGSLLDVDAVIQVQTKFDNQKDFLAKDDINGYKNSVKILGSASYDGQQLGSESQVQYYWLIKDSSGKVDACHPQYLPLVGKNWACLNSYEEVDFYGVSSEDTTVTTLAEPTKVRVWDNSNNFIEIFENDDPENKIGLDQYENIMKCVIRLGDNIVSSKEFIVYNYKKESFSATISHDEPAEILFDQENFALTCVITNSNTSVSMEDYTFEYKWYESSTGEEEGSWNPILSNPEDSTSIVTGNKIYVYNREDVGNVPGDKNIYVKMDPNIELGGVQFFKCIVEIFDKNSNRVSEESADVKILSRVSPEIEIYSKTEYKCCLSTQTNLQFQKAYYEDGEKKGEWNGDWNLYIPDGNDRTTLATGEWIVEFEEKPLTDTQVFHSMDIFNDDTILESQKISEEDFNKGVYVYYTSRTLWYQKNKDSGAEAEGAIKTDAWIFPIIARQVAYIEGGLKNLKDDYSIDQLNTFNQLTQGGVSQGIFYADIGTALSRSDTPDPSKQYYVRSVATDGAGFQYDLIQLDIDWGFKPNKEYWIKEDDNSYSKANANSQVSKIIKYYEKIQSIDDEGNIIDKYKLLDFNTRNFTANETNWPASETGPFYENVKERLLINADYIQTGTLRVGDADTERFYASIDDEAVRIGGFNVTSTTLSAGSGNSFISLQTTENDRDYTPAAYVEFGGAQYIDTGLVLDYDTDAFEITVQPTVANQKAMFFGVWDAANSYSEKTAVLYHDYNTSTSSGKVTFYLGGSGRSGLESGIAATDLTTHTYKFSNKTLYVDGSEKANTAEEWIHHPTSTFTTCIGAVYRSNQNDPNWHYKGKIYGCKIWRNGNLIRNFIPVFKGGNYGLYDICLGQFYENKGVGKLGGAPDNTGLDNIQLNGISYTRLDYIQNDGTNYIETGISNLNYETGFSIEVEYMPLADTISNTSGTDSRCCLLSNHGEAVPDLSLELKNNEARFYSSRDLVSVSGVRVGQKNKSTFTFRNGKAQNVLNDFTSEVQVSDCTGNIPSSLRIFVDRINRFETFSVSWRLYSMKIYSGNTKVAHYLPAKNSDDIPGLVNLVSGSFLAQAMGNNFTYESYEAKTGHLITNGIDSYRTLQYIESEPHSVDSASRAYIDTGVKANSDIAIEVDAMPLEKYSYYGNLGGYNVTVGGTGDRDGKSYFYCGAETSNPIGISSEPVIGVREVVKQYGKKCYRNGIDVGEEFDNPISGTCNHSMVLFARRQLDQESLDDYGKIRIYSCKIWNNGRLIRNFVPVIKNETEYGMYDLVNREFYGNANPTGSGSFSGKSYTAEFTALYLGGTEPELAPFNVTNTGKLKATAGSIGGFIITDALIKSNNNNLQLNSNGSIIAKSGEIGGFIITDASIKSSNNNLQLISDGTIIAKSGKIADWTIGDIVGIWEGVSTTHGKGIYNWQEDKSLSTGMAVVPGDNVVAFWAGCNKKTPWYQDANTPFYVTNEGKMVAKKGQIGNCTIAEDGSISSASGAFKVSSEGDLIASSGSIAGWNLVKNLGPEAKSPGVSYYDPNLGVSTGIAMVGDPGLVTAFWAGCNAENPWMTGATSQFYVCNNGFLYASEGQIGDCQFNKSTSSEGGGVTSDFFTAVSRNTQMGVIQKDNKITEVYFNYTYKHSNQEAKVARKITTNNYIDYNPANNDYTGPPNEGFVYHWSYAWTRGQTSPALDDLYQWTNFTNGYPTNGFSLDTPYLWYRCIVEWENKNATVVRNTITALFFLGQFYEDSLEGAFSFADGALIIAGSTISNKNGSAKIVFGPDGATLKGNWVADPSQS